MKSRILIVLAAVSLISTGCFNITHFMQLNDDGTIDVKWQFDMSKELAKMDKKKSQRKENKESIVDKLKENRDELSGKLKDNVKDLAIKEIDDEFSMGLLISFTAKKYFKLAGKEDEFTLMPEYDKKKNRLVFVFNPNKGKKPAPKKKMEKGEDKDGDEAAKKDPMGMGKIVEAIMGSARYQLILGGNYAPKKAELFGKKSKKTYPVTVQTLGSQHFITFPFMSIAMKEVEGFQLNVYLQ